MRKYWRVGLVLLVALAACSDKKAEQADALKKEIQDSLAQAAAGSGPQKALSYGDVTVAPDGDAFDVTIDKVAVTIDGIQPVDLGKIGFKLTPDGDDLRKFSDLSLPSSIVVKSADGKDTFKTTLVLDHGSGSWSKKLGLGQLLSADLLFKSIDVSKDGTPVHLGVTDTAYQVTSTDAGNGLWDQQGGITAKHLHFDGPNGQVDADDFVLKSAVGGGKLAEVAALRTEMQSAAASKDPGQMFDAFGKLLNLFKSAKVNFSFGKVAVVSNGQPVFGMSGVGLDFGLDDADQPKIKTTTGLRYAGLAMPQIAGLVGGFGAQVLPTDLNLTISVADLPFKDLLAAWGKSVPADAASGGQQAMMATGMAAAGAASQVIAQSPVTLTLSDGTLTAPALNGKFSGEMTTTAGSGTGTLNVELSDLDAVIAAADKYKEEPATATILGFVQQIRALSDRGTDAAGKPIDRFKVTYDSSGVLVNGKPLIPGGGAQ